MQKGSMSSLVMSSGKYLTRSGSCLRLRHAKLKRERKSLGKVVAK